MIRIIGGKYRSRQLTLPPSDGVRPTQDRVREAVFSALGDKVISSRVLDLFAGSGSYGFEAISRGAKEAYFGDINQKCLAAIKDSSVKLGCLSQIHLLRGDYKKIISSLEEQKNVFDLIFLDPPYLDVINKDIILSVKESILSGNGIVVAEQEQPLTEIEGFVLKAYKYSYKRVGIYKRS